MKTGPFPAVLHGTRKLVKYKVPFWDRTLLSSYYKVLSVFSVAASFIFLVYEIPEHAQMRVGIGMITVFAAIYILMWALANHKKSITLNINGSTLEICAGDLFACDGFKVIAFNEFFDTQVDDVLISSRSLNGRYILEQVADVPGLDARIASDPHLRNCALGAMVRPVGKQTRYALGTIFKNGEYFLTAFSRFDPYNRAYLEMNDYINCLMNFWNECDVHYAGQPVSMALMGAGLTRFRGNECITEQELLEAMIWTFKASKIRFSPPSKARIVLTGDLLRKVNLYSLKGC